MPGLDHSLTHLLWSHTGSVWALLACGWALWRGDRFERIGGGAFALSWFLSSLIAWLHPRVGPAPLVMAIDVITSLIFIGIMIWSRKLWVFLFTASLLNLLAAHVMAAVAHLGQYAYVTAIGLWGGYVPLIILTVAMALTERRRRRAATDIPTVSQNRVDGG